LVLRLASEFGTPAPAVRTASEDAKAPKISVTSTRGIRRRVCWQRENAVPAASTEWPRQASWMAIADQQAAPMNDRVVSGHTRRRFSGWAQ